jgi:hypothetical protein
VTFTGGTMSMGFDDVSDRADLAELSKQYGGGALA